MTQIVSDLEAMLEEVKALREFKANQTAYAKDLEKKLDHAEYWVRKLREKCSILEKKPSLLDGVDEEWLFENQAEVRFVRKFEGGRRVEIRARNKPVAKAVGKDGESLLRKALEAASGRTRGRQKD